MTVARKWMMVVVLVGVTSGCQTWCRHRRPFCDGNPGVAPGFNQPGLNPSGSATFIPPPPPRPSGPFGGAPSLPPGAVTTPPPGATILPGNAPPPIGATAPTLPPGAVTTPPAGALTVPPPGTTLPPMSIPAPPRTSNSYSVMDPLLGSANPGYEKHWQPAEARADSGQRLESDWKGNGSIEPRLNQPIPGQSPLSQPQVQLFRPEPIGSAEKKETVAASPPISPEPPLASIGNPSSSFPVGIPQFSRVNEKIATGERPLLEDGFDWLPRNGFRTVLFLRKPGEADQVDRRRAEKFSLQYLTLEISPETLNKEKLRTFLETVQNESSHPIFVYDLDGSLAASLWYAFYRQVEVLPDADARRKARAQGLRGDPDGPRLAMWLAVQRVLNEP